MLEPKETGIAINAAERTNSDCAQEIPLHGSPAMRPKYLGTTAMWTVPFGVNHHSYMDKSVPFARTRGFITLVSQSSPSGKRHPRTILMGVGLAHHIEAELRILVGPGDLYRNLGPRFLALK